MIELVGYVAEGTLAESTATLDTVRAAFSLREPHTLRFTPLGQDERQMAVVVASRFDAPVSGRPPVLEWAIVLEAPDPRQYSAELIEVSYFPGTGAETTHGLDFPLDFPLFFNTASTPGGTASLSAFNTGNVATPVVLTVDGPTTGLTAIENRTTDEAIALSIVAVPAGHQLVIDTGHRTIELDGVSRPDLINAAGNTWFDLEPGENVLAMVGAGFIPDVTRLTASYREARI